MKDSLISVIIPVYNIESYISRTLESVLSQTHHNIEIIVVNDGSTDKTGEIIEKYRDRYPEKIRTIHIQNSGVTNARLTGVASSKGQWIGFVDGDDEIEEDMYEFLLKNAVTYQADISHCGYQMIFSDGRISYFHNTGKIMQQDKWSGLKELLDGSVVEPGLCNKLFKADLLHKLLDENSMDKSIKNNEDLLMNYYLFSYAVKAVFVDECKYHYIARETSASRQRINKHIIYDPIKVKDHIMQISTEKMRPYAQKAYLHTCINVYNGLIFSSKKEYEEEICNVRKLLCERRKWVKLLGQKRKLLARLIIYVPWCYKPLNWIYTKYIQKDPYK